MVKLTTPEFKTQSNTLTITMHDRNAPTYEFTGQWAGRDIKVIQRTLVRAYNTKIRSARRLTLADLSDITEPLPAKG